MDIVIENWEIILPLILVLVDMVVGLVSNSKFKHKGYLLQLLALVGDAARKGSEYDGKSNQKGHIEWPSIFPILFFFVMVFCILSIPFINSGCSTDNSLVKIDGEVSTIERALVQTAVSGAFAAYPEAAKPANEVSALLMGKTNSITEVQILKEAVNIELQRYTENLTVEQKIVFNNFVSLVKEGLKAQLEPYGDTIYLVAIKLVIEETYIVSNLILEEE